MGKIFPILVIVVAIVGFSASAYFFSQTEITIENPISMEIQINNPVMKEIERCIEQNLAGESSIALNSFNTNMLLTLKETAMETEDEKELEQIKEKLYTLTNCKP
ncbi:MAG: hypothetical protein HOM82_01335 [Thaumarchaeota archaeon]|jgi:uncharacterized BrkB/YihY/UPF0761 family membrane protein|nr:hypothetical protein [Nitrososphaerota archaeon]MBT3743771.1 hypothetical protein [Nitrososphaerota archaeon]MBT4057175.1 hypothetical protein [Nitrososphaerota archaeon]MBT4175317.1 hypothetical protein [Nitrososphaerota archaeon]MBT4509675.1 hypothetical protein [Nitrososphaerota archaeon]